jgi:hypothetical protein
MAARMEPSLAFLLSGDDVAWVDKPRTSGGWLIPASERRRAASAAARGVLVDGAAPRRQPPPDHHQSHRGGGSRIVAPTAVVPRDGAFADLPDELLVIVLGHLEPRVLGRLARTCRRLRRVASGGALWSVLFRKRFPRAYRSRAIASLSPERLERLPWKRTYCEQHYEQWARRRHALEQQREKQSERQQAEARQWCKVGGRGTQRLYNTVYADEGGGNGGRTKTTVGSANGSPVRRQGPSSANAGSPVVERSLGVGSSFFMEQMAANTRQYLKPSNKKRFLKAGTGGGRGGAAAAAAAGSRGMRGGGERGGRGGRGVMLPLGSQRQQGRRSRPQSAAAPPGRPQGPSLAPPPTA